MKTRNFSKNVKIDNQDCSGIHLSGVPSIMPIKTPKTEIMSSITPRFNRKEGGKKKGGQKEGGKKRALQKKKEKRGRFQKKKKEGERGRE